MNTYTETVCEDHDKGIYAMIAMEEQTYGDSPRDWADNLGTMVCAHRRYNLGDEQVQDLRGAVGEVIEDFYAKAGVPVRCTKCDTRITWEYGYWHHYDEAQRWEGTEWLDGFMEDLDTDHEGVPRTDWMVWLPLYLHDHSGLAMSCGGGSLGDFEDWDSGMVGFIWASLDKGREWFGYDGEYRPDRETLRGKVLSALEREVATYSQYLEGDIWYAAEVTHGGEVVDSVRGIYGSDEAERTAVDLYECYLADLRRQDLEDQMHTLEVGAQEVGAQEVAAG